jgi:hypothetical protein
MILLPLVLPELHHLALVGSAFVGAGFLAMLLVAGEPPIRLLAGIHATVLASGAGWLFAAVHRLAQRQTEAASRAQRETLLQNEQLIQFTSGILPDAERRVE